MQIGKHDDFVVFLGGKSFRIKLLSTYRKTQNYIDIMRSYLRRIHLESIQLCGSCKPITSKYKCGSPLSICRKQIVKIYLIENKEHPWTFSLAT